METLAPLLLVLLEPLLRWAAGLALDSLLLLLLLLACLIARSLAPCLFRLAVEPALGQSGDAYVMQTAEGTTVLVRRTLVTQGQPSTQPACDGNEATPYAVVPSPMVWLWMGLVAQAGWNWPFNLGRGRFSFVTTSGHPVEGRGKCTDSGCSLFADGRQWYATTPFRLTLEQLRAQLDSHPPSASP
jgi:hypothetical protein